MATEQIDEQVHEQLDEQFDDRIEADDSGRALAARPRPTRRADTTGSATGSSVAGVRLGITAAVLALVCGAGALVMSARGGTVESVLTLLPFSVAAGVLGGVLIARRPRHPVGWAFAATGVMFCLGLVAEQYALHGLVTDPGSLPGATSALWLQSWLFPPALVPAFVVVPLYFPDGRLTSPRWRPVALAALGLFTVSAVLVALTPAPVRLGDTQLPNPYGVQALSSLSWLTDWGLALAWVALVAAAVANLTLRYLAADAEQRRQITWLLYGMGIVALGFAIDVVLAAIDADVHETVLPLLRSLPIVVVLAATIAILRPRLFDIDRLINRTMVWVVLTTCVITTYLLVVVGLGGVLGAERNPVLGLIAVGVIAVAFAPVRERVQRMVNQVLYGSRDDPYRMLALLGRRMEAVLAPDAVAHDVAETVAEALALPYVAVESGRPGAFVTAAEHGRRPADSSGLVDVPLRAGGEPIGRLLLAPRDGGRSFSGADQEVLEAVARQVGHAVHAAQRSADLQRSRERLVLAREEERRRVGRELHDGLGPQLASLRARLEGARDLIQVDPAGATRVLSELDAEVEVTTHTVRTVAQTLRPPALDALGLLEAIHVHADGLERVPISLDAPSQLPPLTAAVEVAAYRIVQEALNNVVVHAGANRCEVRVRHDAGALRIDVADDGIGLRPGHPEGVGLPSMRERASELGGSCTIGPRTGGGTLVRAVLPSRSAATGQRRG